MNARIGHGLPGEEALIGEHTFGNHRAIEQCNPMQRSAMKCKEMRQAACYRNVTCVPKRDTCYRSVTCVPKGDTCVPNTDNCYRNVIGVPERDTCYKGNSNHAANHFTTEKAYKQCLRSRHRYPIHIYIYTYMCI